MGLNIKRRAWKNADGSVTETWRFVIEEWKNGKIRCIYPKKNTYSGYGLDTSDSYDVAIEKLKSIRARDKVQKTTVRRARVDKRLTEEDLKESAFLPRELYKRFTIWISDRRMCGEIPSKSISHLRCMRRLILDLGIDPSEWPDRPEKIYRWFINNKLSTSYFDKVFPLLNEYGYFYCREFKKPFLRVPYPRPDVIHKMEDSNLEERNGKQGPYAPMQELQLLRLADLPDAQLRWLRFSFYFGLRPHEIDKLTEKNEKRMWEIKKDEKGQPYLAVYQTKLTRVERARRWKRIPAILVEQRNLLNELKNFMPVKRPIRKTIEARLGEQYGLYAGRKGFEKFMRSKQQSNVNISRWLGHLDPMRTETNYREIEAVEYDPVPSASKRRRGNTKPGSPD